MSEPATEPGMRGGKRISRGGGARARGERPDPAVLLAEQGETRVEAIAALLLVDQWQRWQAGERVTVEDCFARWPAVAAARPPRCS